MATLADQVTRIVKENDEMKQEIATLRGQIAQIGQVAYTVNCVYLYSQKEPPSSELLHRTLPPTPANTRKYGETGLEYIRKTLLLSRKLLGEKIDKVDTLSRTIISAESSLENAFSSLPTEEWMPPSIETEEIEHLVDEFVPLSIKPTPRSRSSSDDSKKKKAIRGWMRT